MVSVGKSLAAHICNAQGLGAGLMGAVMVTAEHICNAQGLGAGLMGAARMIGATEIRAAAAMAIRIDSFMGEFLSRAKVRMISVDPFWA